MASLTKSELRARLIESRKILRKIYDEAEGSPPLPELSRGTIRKVKRLLARLDEDLDVSSDQTNRTLWRLATVRSPKSGMLNTVEVTTDGSLHPGEAARIGVERVEEWKEIEASSRREALDRIVLGEGEKKTANIS